jgi:crotonobetainyl-CoA:carnitine CoA-transferase CaiB-like acyl-CoA transferase
LLEAANVPAGPINRLDQVFADPQVVHRGMRLDLPHGSGGTVPSVRNPIIMDGAALPPGRAAPMLGEHSIEIVGELGYDAAAIAKLIADGAVRAR